MVILSIKEDIKPSGVEESHEAMRAMFLATKPNHKKYWDKEAFDKSFENFSRIHGILDSAFRPPTYMRVNPRESRRPGIAIEISTSAEEHEV